MAEQDTKPVADEDMFYGGSYWVWDVPGLGLRVATQRECAAEIKRLRQALEDVSGAQPIWHGGVGRMPYEHLVGHIEDMKTMAREALGHDRRDRVAAADR